MDMLSGPVAPGFIVCIACFSSVSVSRLLYVWGASVGEVKFRG